MAMSMVEAELFMDLEEQYRAAGDYETARKLQYAVIYSGSDAGEAAQAECRAIVAKAAK